MIEAGAVGAVFTIKDEASVVLRAIAVQMNAMQSTIDKLAVSFKAIKLPPGVATSIGRMDKAMSDAMLSAGKLEGSMADIGVAADRGAMGAVAGFGKIDASISTTQGKLAALRKEMGAVGRGVGGGNGGVPGIGGRGTHGAGGGAGGSPFHSSFHAGPVGMRSHDIQTGAVAVAAFSLWESLKAGGELAQVQENLKAGGVTGDQISAATSRAYDIGRKYGLTARDVLQGMNEIRNPLNKGTSADEGVKDAMRHMDTLGAAAVVLKAQGGKNGGDTARELYDMVKSAEFRNAIGDKQFDAAINGVVRADVATGGIVTPNAFLQMSQMMKSSLPGVSDDFLYKIMPEMAQEFRGAPAGTAMASLYQQLIAGQMKTKGLNLLADLGLVNDDKVQFNTTGMIKAANPGFYKDADVFRSNPLKGIADLIDAMKAHGITSESDQRDQLSNIFGNRNAAQMAQTLAFQVGRLQRGAQGIGNTNDVNTIANDLLKNNPKTDFAQFTSSTTNAAASLGTLAMPGAIQSLNGLTTVANALGQMLRGDTANINRDAVNDVLFGGKNSALRSVANWAEGDYAKPFVGGVSHTFAGRDPRSPQTGTLAYVPPSAPVSVSVTAPLSGNATVHTGPINLNVNGASIVAALASEITAKIEGLFRSMGASGTNGDSGHDGRASPAMPDHMHYGAH